MLALYLIAAHMVGDFVLQTRWQAAGKLDDPRLRARHVAAYCLPFAPIVVMQTLTGHFGAVGHDPGWFGRWSAAFSFLAFLAVLHYLTDSRRFHSTLGDLIAWRWQPGFRWHSGNVWDAARTPPPNPWPPLPIVLDQALHVVQLAILGGLFLS